MQIITVSPLFHLWVLILWFLFCCSLPLSAIAGSTGSIQKQKIIKVDVVSNHFRGMPKNHRTSILR